MSARDKQIQQVGELLKDNPALFNNQIANIVGVSKGSVRDYRKVLGLPSRNDYLLREAERLFNENPDLSLQEAADRLTVDRTTVVKYRKKLGLCPRRKVVTRAQREQIIHMVNVEKQSKMDVARKTGLHWGTINKILRDPAALTPKRVEPLPSASVINQLLMQPWKQKVRIDRTLVEV